METADSSCPLPQEVRVYAYNMPIHCMSEIAISEFRSERTGVMDIPVLSDCRWSLATWQRHTLCCQSHMCLLASVVGTEFRVKTLHRCFESFCIVFTYRFEGIYIVTVGCEI